MTKEELKLLIQALKNPHDPWKKDLNDIRAGLIYLLEGKHLGQTVVEEPEEAEEKRATHKVRKQESL